VAGENVPVNGTVILDLDGVVYIGDTAIAGAGAALRSLHDAGLQLLFATNNSWRTRSEGASKIERLTGYPASPEQFISSSSAAGGMLRPNDGPVLFLGGPGIAEAIGECGLAVTEDPLTARSVIVGVDFGVDYAKLTAAMRAVGNGARFIGTNHDATFPTSDGLLPGAGAIVAAVSTAAGQEPELAGKPFEPMRARLRSMLGDGPVWMVGDRPDTDLAMAEIEGWRSVLVLTGVVSDPAEVCPAPDAVLASIADLPDHVGI